jgi:ADP-ribosylation factor-like protein 3
MGAAKSKDCKVVMLGLDNAGKTTVLNTLAQGSNYEIAPTRGFNVQSLQKDDLTLQVHDIGGQASTWRLWPSFLANVDVLVFVVDSADRSRLHEVARAMKFLLTNDKLSGIPMLLWANKQDLLNALTPSEIVQSLDLQLIKDRSFQVIGCSTRDKAGLEDGVDWIHGVYSGSEN